MDINSAPAAVRVTSEVGYAQRFVAGGHKLAVDEPASRRGSDTGPTLSDLVLGGLGACAAITLRMYANRKSWELGTIDVQLGVRRVPDADRIERWASALILIDGHAERSEPGGKA